MQRSHDQRLVTAARQNVARLVDLLRRDQFNLGREMAILQQLPDLFSKQRFAADNGNGRLFVQRDGSAFSWSGAPVVKASDEDESGGE